MKNKKGISLITLVVTIVVVILLAVAVILSLGNNNPINSARIANVVENKDSIESAILAYTGSIKAKTLGALSTEEILTGDDYGIVGESSTTNNEGEKIYIIDKEKFEEKIDSLSSSPSSTGSWYVDGEGHVYLVYEEIKSVPKWMKNKYNKIDDTSLNNFIVVGNSEIEYGFADDGSVGLDFYMKLSKDIIKDKTAYVQFALNDSDYKKIYISEANTKKINGANYYIFTCDVAPKNIVDTITAKVICKTGEVKEYTYSLRDYGEYVINHEEDFSTGELNYAKALLNYGGYAQIYFNYNTEDLANKNLSEADKSLDSVTLDMFEKYNSIVHKYNSNSIVKELACSLIFGPKTTLLFYVKISDDINISDIKVLANDKICEYYKKRNEKYGFKVLENVKNYDLDKGGKVQIITDEEIDIEVINFSCFTSSYISMKNSSNSESLKNLTKSLYLYYLASQIYAK